MEVILQYDAISVFPKFNFGFSYIISHFHGKYIKYKFSKISSPKGHYFAP